MNRRNIEVHPTMLENIADSIDKANAILDLVVSELSLRHKQKAANTTYFQCMALIEMAGAKLSDQWSQITEMLGRKDP